MKRTKAYIPAGETVEYGGDYLVHYLQVDGRLIVHGRLKAAMIFGKGQVEANEIEANTVQADSVRANISTVRKMTANYIFIWDCRASDAILSTTFIQANIVECPKLVMAGSRITRNLAGETIALAPQKGFLRMLFSCWFHRLGSALSWPDEEEEDTAQEPDGEEPEEPAATGDNSGKVVEQVMAYLERNGYLAPPPQPVMTSPFSGERIGDEAA